MKMNECGEGASKAGVATPYRLSVQGYHDSPVSDNYQAMRSHWNTKRN